FWKRDNLWDDSTIFISSSRASENPLSNWVIRPGNASSHHDFADFACHLRREYDSSGQPLDLWLFSDVVHGEPRSYTFYDILLFRSNPSIDTATGHLIGSGDPLQGGHVPFEFYPDGTVSRYGDIRLNVNCNIVSTDYSIWVWIGFSSGHFSNLPVTSTGFNQLPYRPFSFTGNVDRSGNLPTYGWAEITALDSGSCGLSVNTKLATDGPSFGAAGLFGISTILTDSIKTLSEESSINLTRHGLTSPACENLFGAAMLIGRTTTPVSAIIHEAIGPIEFGNFPELSAEAGSTAYLDCNHSTATLAGSSFAPNANALWTTLGGHILSGATTFSTVVDSPGTYFLQVTDTLLSTCQALDSVTVIRIPPPTDPTITINGNLLESSPAVTYQWYLDGQLITGADAQQFTALTDGNYQVQISDSSGCTAISTAVAYFSTGTLSPLAYAVSVYPNPTKGQLHLENLPNTVQQIRLEDMTGRCLEVFKIDSPVPNQTIHLALSQGTYLLRCIDGNGSALAVRRVVIQE
ncbi:MAG: T9SS type A sorting domain-containing protein, partial [Bacteroidota bacterium]